MNDNTTRGSAPQRKRMTPKDAIDATTISQSLALAEKINQKFNSTLKETNTNGNS